MGINSASAKSHLAREIEEASKKVEHDRWLAGPEGQAHSAMARAEAKFEEFKKQFELGQLVWEDSALDDQLVETFGETLARRCSKIVALNEANIEIEMLYAIINGKRVEEYKDWFGNDWTRGQKRTKFYSDMEKHVSGRTGNIWWKAR